MNTHALMGQIDALELVLIPIAKEHPQLVFNIIQAMRQSHLEGIAAIIEEKCDQPEQHKAGFYSELGKIEKICTDILFNAQSGLLS